MRWLCFTAVRQWENKWAVHLPAFAHMSYTTIHPLCFQQFHHCMNKMNGRWPRDGPYGWSCGSVALLTVLSNHQPEAHSSQFLMWRRAEPGRLSHTSKPWDCFWKRKVWWTGTLSCLRNTGKFCLAHWNSEFNAACYASYGVGRLCGKQSGWRHLQPSLVVRYTD